MSAVDLPPGIGLAGTPLGTFLAPAQSRRIASLSLILVIVFGAIAWGFVARHPYRNGSSAQIVLPVAFLAVAALGLAVRRAQVAITRDGVRWGWPSLSFHQPAARITTAHIYQDGVALEARHGAWWFIARRDWDRFEVLVRFVRRSALATQDHDGKAPLRARLQSYGRFLDWLLRLSVLGAMAVMVWAV